MDKRPIGVFDSGLGGLTVLSELKEILPNENFIYFGDNARVPYGSKSKETIIKYSKEIVSFLIKQDVKLIVIACGTASSLAYNELIKEYNIPIINVISPTAKNLTGKNIGIIATKATIKSKAWEKNILKFHDNIKIYSKACPLFVPIVEEGLVNSKILDDTVELYLKDFKNKELDSLILGCTHYPILIKKIKSFMPQKTKIININTACAKEVLKTLKSNNILNSSSKTSLIAYTTDNISDFKKNSKTFCNIEFDDIRKANFDS